MEGPANSSIAICAALRIDTPTALGAPFCVKGRIMPTLTGPEPSDSPTAGPAAAAGGTAVAAPPAPGISIAELQPASVTARPPPIRDRRVRSALPEYTDRITIHLSLPGP